jgi:ferrochelatase
MSPPTPKRCAVVLLNLGGPDSLAAVEPFLYNLFADPDIINLPLGRLTQKPFARLVSRRRAPEAAHGYAAIGGKSPLLDNTRAQAAGLQRALGDDAFVTMAMRYWHPRADAVVTELQRRGITRVVLLPLYPQYSRTTTGSSVNDFRRACRLAGYQPLTTVIPHWYDQPDYLAGIVETIRAEATRFPDPNPESIELLFSAHGLPQKVVAAGDPYERHVRATFEAVRHSLGWPRASLCYQSRVGPLEWLRPYTDDVIRAKAAAGCKQLLIYPIAFVSDHVETLFELGQTYAALARESGIDHYRVVPALNDHPRLIAALTALAREGLGRV